MHHLSIFVKFKTNTSIRIITKYLQSYHNSKTGQCLKCIRNTAGSNCERCLPNYYGNALLKPNAQCTGVYI